ncbi:MAG: hypothetical protein O2958_14850 [Gemmatimonadetes bacterium]|nr:hypothetical protein [Gemmatimonadota bacterium]
MKNLMRSAWIAVMLAVPVAAAAQDIPPLFQQAPAVLYETYRGVNAPVFNEYFSMLADRYADSDGYGWGVYRENPTVAYRITALPEGLQSMVEVQAARIATFETFGESEVALWNSAWGSRHVAVYDAAPGMSVVPAGFTVADIQALPYNRVTVYHLTWDKAPEFRRALAARSALDRAAGIAGFVMTVWNGGIGTEAPTVMVRVSAASQAADIGANATARRAARAAYQAEFGRLSGIMNAAARHIERHDQVRVPRLSHVPGA